MESTADQAVQTIVALVSTWGLRVAGAIAVLVIGRFVCGIARKTVRRTLESRRVDPSLVPFISNLLYFTLLAAVIISVLGIFGIETTSLIAILGTAGLAVGLAHLAAQLVELPGVEPEAVLPADIQLHLAVVADFERLPAGGASRWVRLRFARHLSLRPRS